MNPAALHQRNLKSCVLLRTLSALSLIAALIGASAEATAQADKSTADAGSSLYADLSKASPKAAARRNPLESDPDAVPAGAKLFSLHCAECHGETAEGGKGKKSGPSLRADEVRRATPGTLFWLLTNGVVRRGMPVWSKLPEPQRWQLVSYIKSLGPSSSPKAGGKPSP